MTATLDLSLLQAMDRCFAAKCPHVGKGGRCEYHTRLDRIGQPSLRSTINRKVYGPRKTAGGKPIKMDAAPVYITQVIECAERSERC